jgi:hypothetical protein
LGKTIGARPLGQGHWGIHQTAKRLAQRGGTELMNPDVDRRTGDADLTVAGMKRMKAM